MYFSTTSIWRLRARSITVWRVMPFRKQSAIGREQLVVLDEEDVRARRFGDETAPVVHHRVGKTLGLGLVLGERADHVEAGGFRLPRRGVGGGAAPAGDVELDAFAL